MATLEQLVIEFAADFSQFDAALNQASQKARAKAKELEQSVISPRVNLNPLHELNRLLDIKQRHIRETARVFQQNPLRPVVDTGEIKRATAEVENFKRSFGTMAGVKAEGKATIRVEHEYKVSVRESNQDVARSISGLSKDLKEIVRAVESTKPGLVGRVAGAVSGVAGKALSGAGNILRGAGERLGSELISDVAKGLKAELESSMESRFGSTELIGKGLGRKIANQATSGYQKAINFVDAQVEQEVEKRIQALKKAGIKEAEIDRDAIRAAVESPWKTIQELVTSANEAADSLVDVAERNQQQMVNLANQRKRGKSRQSNISQGRIVRLGQLDQEAKDVAQQLSMARGDRQSFVEQYGARYAELLPDIQRINAQGGAKTRSEVGKVQAFVELAQQMQKADRRVAELEERFAQKKAQLEAFNRAVVQEASVRENLSQAMIALTGQSLSSDQMPNIVAAKMNGARGNYNARRNEITVDPELYSILANRTFDEVINSPEFLKAFEVIVHEMAHAVDFGMGSGAGIMRATRNRTPGRVNVSLGEAVARQGGLSLVDFLGQYSPQKREVEMSAQAQARRAVAQKTGTALVSPIEDAFAILPQVKAQAEALKSMAGSAAVSDGVREAIAGVVKTLDGMQSALQELDAMGQMPLDPGNLEQAQQYQAQLKAKISELLGVNKFLGEISQKVKQQTAGFDQYKLTSASIQQEIDDAFNFDDLKGLRLARKRIDAQIKSVKGDTQLSQPAKTALLEELNALRVRAKADNRLMVQTSEPGLKDMILNPVESMRTLAERKVIEVQDATQEMIHGIFDPVINGAKMIASNPGKALGASGQALLSGANAGIRGVAPAVSAGYGMLQGAENVALSVLPYGHLAKKGIQVGAVVAGLPMAAAAIPALAPVGGMLGAAGHLGGTLASGAAASQLGAISSIPFVGGQVASLLTGAATGLGTIVGEMAAAAVAVNAISVGAKAVVNQALSSETKSSLKALAPGRDAIAGETQKAVGKFVQMAQDMPRTLAALPESQRPIAQKFLPIVATLQEGYAGQLPGQQLSQAQLNLKQLTGVGAAKSLDQSALEAVRQEIVTQYKAASRALSELGQAMQGLAGEERTGMVADLKAQLSNRVKNLAKKAEYVGLRASDIKVEMPSNLPAVDVAAYESAGQNVGEGLSKGIESKIPELVEINKQLFQEGYKAFQNEAEIQSPSQKMEYLGKMLAAGLIAGFDINSEDFAQAIREAMPDLPSLAANLPPIPMPSPWQFDKDYQEHVSNVANRMSEGMGGASDAIDDISASIQESIQENEKLLDSLAGKYQELLNVMEQVDVNSDDYMKTAQKSLDSLVDVATDDPNAFKDVNVDEVQKRLELRAKKLQEAIDYADNVAEAMSFGMPQQDAYQMGMGGDSWGFQTLIEEMRTLNPMFDAFASNVGSGLETLKRLGVVAASGLGLALLAKGLFDVSAASIQVYRDFEGIFIASKMVANGSQYLEKLRGQVRSLGGDLESTMRQGVQFAAGLQGTALEGSAQTMFLQADKALKSIGLQTQQYDAAILAIKQVASKGRVSMEEISGQLGEAVPGALNLAAKAMGTNVQGFIQMVESGNLLSEEFLPKFLAQLEAQTAFLGPEIEKSLNAKMGKFGGNVTNLQVEIGARIAPNLAPLIDKAADAVNFLTENLDKAVFAAQTLGFALALPVLNAGFIALQASIKNGTLAINVMTFSAKGLQMALVGISKALAPLALASAVVGVLEAGFQLWRGTSDGIKDSLKQVSVTADNIAKSYREATKAQAEFMAQASKPAQSSSWFLRGIDAVRERLGLGNYYGQAEEAANKDVFNESMNKIQGTLGLTSKVFDERAMAQYINQASELDSQIKAIQGRASALQLTDPMKNAESISQLREQASALIAEKKRLDDSFIPGGELGLEQTIADLERLKTTYQDLQATQGGDYSAQISEIDNAIGQFNKRLSITKEINEQITNTLNRQRLAFIELNAEIAKRNQSLQISKNLTDANLLARQARQEIGDKIVPQLQAQVELTYQEDMLSEFQRSVQKGRETLRQKLDPNVRSVLEELSGQSLETIDIEGLTLIQEKLKTAGDRVKGTINDDILAELEKLANSDLQMSETKRAIEQARVALMQSNRDLTDYYRDLGRQFQDFYLGLAEQQMSIEQQTEGFNRQLEDAQIQYVRENRQLQEDFSDLMDDLAMQLKQAQNQLKDTQAKIRQTRFDREILEIDPGNNNSLGRRLAGIFQNLFKALDGNASESRNLETQLAQVQREYVNTMRRIRSIQEQQIDIERNRARQMRDLYLAEQQLLIAVQRAVIQLARQIEDFNIQVIRNLGNAGNAYRVGGQLNAPAIVRPGAPNINGRPITGGGGGSGGGGGAGGQIMSEAPRLNFGLTSSKISGTETAGPIQWLQKQWEERVVKPAQRFMKDPVGSIQRRIDAINHTWGNMVKEPMQWRFHNQRGNLAHKYLIELMRRLGLTPEEINKTLTQAMVDQLATGQKFSRIKIRGQNIPQQAFEEFVKNNGSQFISPNFRSQQRPTQPPRPANNIVPTNRPPQRPSAPQPQVAAPRPVAPPQPPRRQEQVQRPVVAPAMTSGWNLPALNFSGATGLAGNLRDVQIDNIGAQQNLLEEQRLNEITNATEQLAQLQRELNAEIRRAKREYESTTLSVRDMIAGSKGYLTVQEEMTKAASDTREQFDSQIFSLREQIITNQERVAEQNKYAESIDKQLATQENLSDTEKQNLESKRQIASEIIKALDNENANLEITLATLEANKELSVQKRLQYETRQKENEIMNAQSQIAVALVEAQYKAGQAGIINQAGVMRAVMESMNALKQAQDMLDKALITPEYLEMVKETGKLNIQESINNAIPGLNEFTQGLGEVIKGTKSWNDAMKDVLTSIADVVLQMLVLAPLRNMLGRVIGDSLGMGDIATNAPSGGGFNIGGLFGGLFGGIGSLLGFPMGGKIPYYADGGIIGESFNKERSLSGKQPRLVVAHDGEQVLSTLNGDAQLWRALKRTGRWDELKTPTRIPGYATGGSVGYSGGSSGGRPMGNTLVINQNYKITTPDADSFRKSKAQMAIEEANRTRRLTQRNG
jgi:tape measure domain-containing protein